MRIDDTWTSVIADGHTIREVDEEIYSVLPEDRHTHLYDRRATAYDFVVGTRLYNRVMWGTSPPHYVEFARQACDAHPDVTLLDAACGSLLFTASAYLDCERPIIAFDQSLQMLRRARARLIDSVGSVPERIVLLQADLRTLPFRPRSFQVVLCMNVLHHLEDASGVIGELKKLLVDGGKLYLTSLVKGNRVIGDRYLDVLYRSGGFAHPRTGAELRDLLASDFGGNLSYRVHGNMAYATAIKSQ